MKERGLLLLSGGLDSSVLLAHLRRQDVELKALFFDRDQGALQFERAAAERVSRQAGVKLDYVSIRDWRAAVKQFEAHGSIILKVPRNAIMVLLASPFALAYNCQKIYIGSSMDDATTPDSNEKFIESINHLLATVELKTAGDGGVKKAVRVAAPFLELGYKKLEIMRWAFDQLGRDFVEQTRSCYEPTPEPCGVCSACIKRARALEAVLAERGEN